MRSILFAAALCLVFLAACGGAPQPTATPVPPATEQATAAVVAGGDDPAGTLAATFGAPAPGTLVMPAQQETLNAPTAAPIALDRLFFSQTGGIAGISLTIELHGDGTLIRNGKSETVSLDDVRKIEELLDGIRFYDLQGTFAGVSGAADAYQYSLTVSSRRGSRMISSQDGMTPPELYQVYDAIRSLGGG